MRVRCGQKEVWWVNLVVAAARMQSHKDDQLQYFPSVDNILTLDALRYQCDDTLHTSPNESLILELVSMHCYFQSTDPRDKIYAILGMAIGPTGRAFLKIDYSLMMDDLYIAFALLALERVPRLEIFRHCHARSTEALPS
jgi:hypothetical protein